MVNDSVDRFGLLFATYLPSLLPSPLLRVYDTYVDYFVSDSDYSIQTALAVLVGAYMDLWDMHH